MNPLSRFGSAGRDAALFLTLACFWGTSFVAIEVGLPYFPPMLFAGVRYAAAGAIILAYAAVTADRLLPRGRDEWTSVLVAGGLIIGAYHGLLYLGQMHVPGAVSSVVVSLSPVLTAVFAAVVLSESMDRFGVLGFLLGIAGVVVVADPDPANLLSADILGVGLVFLGCVTFALGAVLTRPLRVTLPTESMQGWAMLLGAGILFVASFARGESPASIEWTLPAVASLAYLTLVSGVVAFLIYFTLLDRVGATEVNLIGYLEPVVAATVSWAVLDHVVGAQTLVGFVAVFAGFALVKRDALRARLGLGDPAAPASHGYDAD
ncbi:DMT family transporter [Halopelagius fulvigenes]|uniref:DMT family transporter n=1 Tax=Halopelagius fulvigenes TaxID=1198324 RepID=A0ABD5TXL7_9EURY